MTRHKIILDEDSLPTHWYNLGADLPLPGPPLHPGTLQPLGPEEHGAALPDVDHPAGGLGRGRARDPRRGARGLPHLAPHAAHARRSLRAARSASRACASTTSTRAGSPSGSRKPNTAVPQAFYCAQDGRKRIATETGAGQWGSALAYATQLYGLECEVFMVGISYRQKPYRRVMMETFGASVHSSPSDVTNTGRAALEVDPESLGSLGLAISRGRRARGHRPGGRTTRSAPCSTTCSCTRP